MNKFYITTTLPYVNADPHIGHAMEFIRADVIARFKRYTGHDVFFNTGTDEHGQKIYEGAQKEGIEPIDYVNKYSGRFQEFCKITNISNDGFIRTSEDRHKAAAIKMWNICLEKGDIYKAIQKINYCVGCEMEKTDSELVDGKCPDHPNRDIVVNEEENYFFKFSKYQNDLLRLYDRGLVKPDYRQTEIRNFVASGLIDFSVSRLKSKMPWGIQVPNDVDHVMYVWFDALNSYISTLGYGSDDARMHYWNEGQVVQYCGKDNNKAQSAIWQAMLLSAGVKNTDIININGHIISGGVKMSKSIGNVINPFDIIERYKDVTSYPEEVLRFLMCHEVSSYDDSDITYKTLDDAYVAYLQNGIGNQVNRILKLSSQYIKAEEIEGIMQEIEKSKLDEEYVNNLNNFEINEALHHVTDKVKKLDEYIQSTEPFKLIKYEETQNEAKEIIKTSLARLLDMSHHLYFFMPRTSMEIYNLVKTNSMPSVPLFNRLNS